MAKCEYCGDEVDYLPFTCRYCGKYYCKNHRIPENHECSFEFKNDPFKIKSIEKAKPSKIYADFPAETIAPEDSDRRERGRFPKFRNRINRTRSQVTSLLGMQAKPFGTYGLMITNTVFFAISIILSIFSVDLDYIYLSISDFISSYRYWTFITSIFIPVSVTSNFFIMFINFFLMLLTLFFIGRMIEARIGWKTLIYLYLLSGLFSSAAILLIQWISSLIVQGFASNQYYSSWGAMIGLVAFIALSFPQQQVTMFLYFIPIQVKMKNLLLIIIGINVIFGLIYLMFGVFSLPQNLGNIAGILGGLIMLRVLRNRV